jgi:N-acylneuraminate cytidylyltransferase
MFEDFLFLIPARGGSKGIPKKNIKDLNGKPLIYYTLDAIKSIAPVSNICVSSDDPEIIDYVERYGFRVPFVRPAELATDTASTNDVIVDALNFYRKKNVLFKGVVLLQPTSPLRKERHILEALNLFDDRIDLVVSVKVTSSNPYFVLFEENPDGFLELSKKSTYTRRQDCPVVYERNGAIYIYNVKSLNSKMILQKKYVMSEEESIDIDNDFDWILAEFILSKNMKSDDDS